MKNLLLKLKKYIIRGIYSLAVKLTLKLHSNIFEDMVTEANSEKGLFYNGKLILKIDDGPTVDHASIIYKCENNRIQYAVVNKIEFMVGLSQLPTGTYLDLDTLFNRPVSHGVTPIGTLTLAPVGTLTLEK
jgi:hypothetical protein